MTVCTNSRGRAGSIMMECVIAFPLVLLLIMGSIQFTHIWIARQLVHYAAYCAARATLVCQAGEYTDGAGDAAELACAWMVKGHRAGEPDMVIPGWGGIPGSGAYARKTDVEPKPRNLDRWNVLATVQHDFALVVPFAGPVIGWLVNPWKENDEWREQRADATGNIGASDLIFHPHVRFNEPAVLPKPYEVVTPTKWDS
jgi:hypothetical protein